MMVPLLLGLVAHQGAGAARQPNILFIMADDLGWNDVSWNNPDMPTPNLARLAEEGIRLEQAYSQQVVQGHLAWAQLTTTLQVCTPSRAAFLTGKYPFHIGRQKRALKPLQPTGLTLNVTTLGEELQELGYATHMVGKWHLGELGIGLWQAANLWWWIWIWIWTSRWNCLGKPLVGDGPILVSSVHL